MKGHNIKVSPLAIQVILGNLSHQKAVVIILSTARQAATQLLYYPRVNSWEKILKINICFLLSDQMASIINLPGKEFLELALEWEPPRINNREWRTVLSRSPGVFKNAGFHKCKNLLKL